MALTTPLAESIFLIPIISLIIIAKSSPWKFTYIQYFPTINHFKFQEITSLIGTNVFQSLLIGR